MSCVEEDLSISIEERLQLPLQRLKRTSRYQKLKKEYNCSYAELTDLLGKNIDVFNTLLDILYSMQSFELHRAYLCGFIDGIRLNKQLQQK